MSPRPLWPALLGALACTTPGVRPLDTDTDDLVDSDTDRPGDSDDSDTDPPPGPRGGCLEGELDEGWRATTPWPGYALHNVRPFGEGTFLAATRENGRGEGGVFLMDVEDWRRGGPDEDTPLIASRPGGGWLFQAPLRLRDGDDKGFGLTIINSSFDTWKHTVYLWWAWPEGDRSEIGQADVSISFETTGLVPASVADFDGDGLDDLALYNAVLLSPLSGSVTAADAEPNFGGSAYTPRLYTDWNEDGYADLVGGGKAYLGPLYGIQAGDPPDITFGPEYAHYTDVESSPAQDMDGDGIAELWVGPSERGPVYWRMNYPGIGVHEVVDHVQVGIAAREEWQLRRPPVTGDFDGDGFYDAVVYHERVRETRLAELSYLPGPLTSLNTPVPAGLPTPHTYSGGFSSVLAFVGDLGPIPPATPADVNTAGEAVIREPDAVVLHVRN